MPGKVNPVIPEVVLQVSRAGDRQRHRDHRRRPAGPVRAQRAHPADRAQPAPVAEPARRPPRALFAEKCVDGIQANRAGADASAGATLAVATALNGASATTRAPRSSRRRPPRAARCARSRSRRASTPKLYDETIDLRKIARGNRASRRAMGRRRARAARRGRRLSPWRARRSALPALPPASRSPRPRPPAPRRRRRRRPTAAPPEVLASDRRIGRRADLRRRGARARRRSATSTRSRATGRCSARLQSGDPAAIQAAVHRLVYSHTHIVRLRVSRGCELLVRRRRPVHPRADQRDGCARTAGRSGTSSSRSRTTSATSSS